MSRQEFCNSLITTRLANNTQRLQLIQKADVWELRERNPVLRNKRINWQFTSDNALHTSQTYGLCHTQIKASSLHYSILQIWTSLANIKDF